MYGKLIDGNLRIASKMLHIGSTKVWNASAADYAAQGWLPVVYTDMPTPPEGYDYESGWEQTEDSIVQTWTLVELPDDIDDAEALNIILGGDTQ